MKSVLVFGSGDCGQLGLGEDVTSKKKATAVVALADKDIIDIAAGGLHTLVLSSNGQVYSWGCNDEKALGRSGAEFEVGLVNGIDGEKVLQVAAGDSISAALTATGIYCWGTFRDSRGVLGFSSTVHMQEHAVKLDLPGMVQLSAGSNHIVALSADHCIYAWGCGEQGQLGKRVLERHKMQSLNPRNMTPKRRGFIPNFTAIACGSYHTLAIDGEGRVWSWGLNNYGQLGLGDVKDRITPEPIDPSQFGGERVVAASGGEHHSLVLTESGKVFSFGRGDSCQLGIEGSPASVKVPIRIRALSDLQIRSIASGSNHNLALDSTEKVYSWGFGEMLQLGTGKEEDETVPVAISLPNSAKAVHKIQGGGQHSVLLVEQ